MQLFKPLPVLQSQYNQAHYKNSASKRARNGRLPMDGGHVVGRNWTRAAPHELVGREDADLLLQGHLDQQMALAYHSAHLGQ